jgi:pimeloyl-ACP methyl ester carboxylesterase
MRMWRWWVLWSAPAVVGVALLATGVVGLGAAGEGMRSQAVRVGGVPVEVVRPAVAGAGRPAVVVVHGYAGSGRLMRPFADTLVRRGYVVALPDLAGHGANTRPLTGPGIDREIAAVVGYLRTRPDVDPARVALLGHSMGAAAVVRAGSADPAIPATVAISLGDDEAGALRPGPRRLLLVAGALEPGGILSTTRTAGRAEGRRVVTVPWVEHVSVLFAGRTHDEAARWLDDALAHRPEVAGVAGSRRVGAGAATLAGALLVLAAGLLFLGRARAGGEQIGTAGTGTTGAGLSGPAAPADTARTGAGPAALWWLGGAVLLAPVAGIIGGLLLARVLPAPVSGYLVGYFAGAGAVLLAGDLARRHRGGTGRQHPSVPRRPEMPTVARAEMPTEMPAVARTEMPAVVPAVGLAVVVGPAVIVSVHAGLTAMVPHGGHRWQVALLALATAVLLAGAQTAGRPLWTVGVLALVCLPLPAAALVGLAPGFLMLIAPLVAILFAVHLAVVALAWRAGIPAWRTVAAGALVIAWPVATALPLG